MKVNSKNVSQSLGLNKSQSKGLEKNLGLNTKGGTSSAGAAAPAKVDLSSQAQAMQKAKSIASDNSVDEAKVARLQQLIDSGKYKTDANAIADRLVDEHLSTLT